MNPVAIYRSIFQRFFQLVDGGARGSQNAVNSTRPRGAGAHERPPRWRWRPRGLAGGGLISILAAADSKGWWLGCRKTRKGGFSDFSLTRNNGQIVGGQIVAIRVRFSLVHSLFAIHFGRRSWVLAAQSLVGSCVYIWPNGLRRSVLQVAIFLVLSTY